MANSVIGGAYVKEGVAHNKLSADDLYDKIINLKFIRANGDSFVIRSDYEPVFNRNGTVDFKRCTMKPDIKVTYKQVAQNVAIKVDIEITNYFIDPGSGKNGQNLFSAKGNPVAWIVIQMGYRNQFPDWTKDDRKNNVQQFYDLNNHGLTIDKEVRRGNQIVVQILTGYQKSYPPDSVTYFQGIVGTMSPGLRLNHTEAALDKNFGDENFPDFASQIEAIFFEYITKRFIRSDILHLTGTTEDLIKQLEKEPKEQPKQKPEENEEVKFAEKIYIYEKKLYDDPPGEYKKDESKWGRLYLDPKTGAMTTRDAKKFGTRCVVSQSLRKAIEDNSLYTYSLVKEGKKLSYENLKPSTPFTEMSNTLGGQITAIQQHFKFIRCLQMSDGNFYFYHEKDTDEDLMNDAFVKNLRNTDKVFLPAIYEMTPSGTRTIKCPFISFLGPGKTVIFETRYDLGTLVSFFYTPTTNAFLVITAQIEFATVQESNVMELMCIDQPRYSIEWDENGLPKDDLNQFEAEEPEDTSGGGEVGVTGKQVKRYKYWMEEVPVVKKYTETFTKHNNWNDFSEELERRADLDAWAEADDPEGYKDEKRRVEKLRELNLKLWSDNMKDGLSLENSGQGLGVRVGITVSYLYVSNSVKMPNTYLPNYDPDDEIELPTE